MAGYDVADVGELEAEGPGGMVRKVRRAVDGKAFGFNYFILPPNQEGREHEHSDTNQEEVYFVVKGSGTIVIRVTASGADGLEFVTFGAPIDTQYEPPSWG